MTETEAAQRAENYVNGLVATLPIRPRLQVLDQSTGKCLDPTDGGSRDRVEVTRDYWLRDLPKDRNSEYFEAAIRYWNDHGFQVIADDHSVFRTINVENKSDGFLMQMETSTQGDISLGATSPCIWPQGTPAPPTS